MNNEILDESINTSENENQYLYKRGLKFLYAYLICILISSVFLSLSDGHPLIDDGYARFAILFFIGFLYLGVVSIVFTIRSVLRNERQTRSRYFLIFSNCILIGVYIFCISLFFYEISKL